MRIMILVVLLSFLGCASQPSQEQVAIWTYFLRQCQNEGINDLEAMQGCISLKLQQANVGSRSGNILQGMGAALNPDVYQGLVPQSVNCRTTPLLMGGYRTVCY